MLANPGKPNGGILERYKLFGTIPFFGITFDGDTPTNGPQNPDGSYVAPTKDISFLYDGVSDHPVWSLNFLALANALAGYVYLHGETPAADDNLIYQGSAGDTDYYVIDSGIVPILRPLGSLGVLHFLLSALHEPTQVLIESAFRRDLGLGVPVQASLLPRRPDHVGDQPDQVDSRRHRQRFGGTRCRQEAGHDSVGAVRRRRSAAARSAGSGDDHHVGIVGARSHRTRCAPGNPGT